MHSQAQNSMLAHIMHVPSTRAGLIKATTLVKLTNGVKAGESGFGVVL